MTKRYYDLDFRPTVKTAETTRKRQLSAFNPQIQHVPTISIPLPKPDPYFSSEYQRNYQWPIEILKSKDEATETSPKLPIQNEIDFIVKPMDQKVSKVTFENGTLSKPWKQTTSNQTMEGANLEREMNIPVIYKEKQSQTILDMTMDLIAKAKSKVIQSEPSNLNVSNTTLGNHFDKPTSTQSSDKTSKGSEKPSKSDYQEKPGQKPPVIWKRLAHGSSDSIPSLTNKISKQSIIRPQPVPIEKKQATIQNKSDKHSFLSYGWANSDPFNPVVDHKSFNVTMKKEDIQPFVQERSARILENRLSHRPSSSKPISDYPTEYKSRYGGRKVHSPFRLQGTIYPETNSPKKPDIRSAIKKPSDIYQTKTSSRMIQPIGHKKLTRTHHHDMYRGLGGQDVQLSLPPQKKYLWLDGDVQVKRDFTHKEKNAETQTNH